jgi:hypothetical protein
MVVELRRINWVGHVFSMVWKRTAYRVFLEYLEGRGTL